MRLLFIFNDLGHHRGFAGERFADEGLAFDYGYASSDGLQQLNFEMKGVARNHLALEFYAVEGDSPDKDGGEKKSGSGLVVIVLLLLMAGGGALYWFKLRKKKPDTKGPVDLDDYDYGDEDEDEEYENEDDADEPEEMEDADA